MVRRSGQILVAALLAVLVLEVSLQLAAALHRVDRGQRGLRSQHHVVLCVGDSHTWGLGEGYPKRLAERLSERSDQFRVINLGVPGTNTSQLRHRFDAWLERYRPRLVVVWAGINNKWNRAEATEGISPPPSLLDRLVSVSRLARFLRVWHEHGLIELDAHRDDGSLAAAALEAQPTYVLPDETIEARPPSEGRGKWRHERRLFGARDAFDPVPVEEVLSDEIVARQTEADLRPIVESAHARGVGVILVAYPHRSGAGANRGIRAIAHETDSPVVESREAMDRVRARYASSAEPAPALFRKAHPTAITYNEVGDMILKEADRRGFLAIGRPTDP